MILAWASPFNIHTIYSFKKIQKSGLKHIWKKINIHWETNVNHGK